jgi:hypothetical protein
MLPQFLPSLTWHDLATRTGLTGAVEITWVWKLKGLGVDAGVGTTESAATSSSPDMASEGGASK